MVLELAAMGVWCRLCDDELQQRMKFTTPRVCAVVDMGDEGPEIERLTVG
jgi:hypothetical protein